MKSLELFSRNLCKDFFLKIGRLSVKVYTKKVPNIEECNFIHVPLRLLTPKQVIVVLYLLGVQLYETVYACVGGHNCPKFCPRGLYVSTEIICYNIGMKKAIFRHWFWPLRGLRFALILILFEEKLSLNRPKVCLELEFYIISK